MIFTNRLRLRAAIHADAALVSARCAPHGAGASPGPLLASSAGGGGVENSAAETVVNVADPAFSKPQQRALKRLQTTVHFVKKRKIPGACAGCESGAVLCTRGGCSVWLAAQEAQAVQAAGSRKRGAAGRPRGARACAEEEGLAGESAAARPKKRLRFAAARPPREATTTRVAAAAVAATAAAVVFNDCGGGGGGGDGILSSGSDDDTHSGQRVRAPSVEFMSSSEDSGWEEEEEEDVLMSCAPSAEEDAGGWRGAMAEGVAAGADGAFGGDGQSGGGEYADGGASEGTRTVPARIVVTSCAAH